MCVRVIDVHVFGIVSLSLWMDPGMCWVLHVSPLDADHSDGKTLQFPSRKVLHIPVPEVGQI